MEASSKLLKDIKTMLLGIALLLASFLALFWHDRYGPELLKFVAWGLQLFALIKLHEGWRGESLRPDAPAEKPDSEEDNA